MSQLHPISEPCQILPPLSVSALPSLVLCPWHRLRPSARDEGAPRYYCGYYLGVFWATPGSPFGLLRALRSGITLGDAWAWGSLGDTGNQVWCQGKWGDLKGKHPRFLLDSGVGGLEYLSSGALQAYWQNLRVQSPGGLGLGLPFPPQLLLCAYKKRFFQGAGHLARGPGGWEEDAARPRPPPARAPSAQQTLFSHFAWRFLDTFLSLAAAPGPGAGLGVFPAPGHLGPADGRGRGAGEGRPGRKRDVHPAIVG